MVETEKEIVKKDRVDNTIVTIFIILGIINAIYSITHGIYLINHSNTIEPDLFFGYLVPNIKYLLGISYIIIGLLVSFCIYIFGNVIVKIRHMPIKKRIITIIMFLIVPPLVVLLLLWYIGTH